MKIVRTSQALLLLLLLNACEDAGELRSRPTDENEGINGYVSEVEEDVPALKPFSMAIDATIATGPSGTFKADSTVRLRTWAKVPDSAAADVGGAEGDIVSVDVFAQDQETLLGSELMAASIAFEQIVDHQDAEKGIAVVVLANPGTEVEEYQLLTGRQVEFSESPALNLAGEYLVKFQLKTTNAVFWVIPYDEKAPPNIKIGSGVIKPTTSSSDGTTYAPPKKHIAINKRPQNMYYATGQGSDWDELAQIFLSSGGNNYNYQQKFYLDQSNSPHFYSNTEHHYFDGIWEMEYFGPTSGTGLITNNLNITQDRSGKPMMMTLEAKPGGGNWFRPYNWDEAAQDYVKATLPMQPWAHDGGYVQPNGENSLGINPLTGIHYFIYHSGGTKGFTLAKSNIDGWPQTFSELAPTRVSNLSCTNTFLRFTEMKFDSQGFVHFLYACRDINEQTKLYYVSDNTGVLSDTFVAFIEDDFYLVYLLNQTTRLVVDPFDNIHIVYLQRSDKQSLQSQVDGFRTDSIEIISNFGGDNEKKISITEGFADDYIWIRTLDMAVDYQGFIHLAYSKDIVTIGVPAASQNNTFNASVVVTDNRSGEFVNEEILAPVLTTVSSLVSPKVIGIRIESQAPE